MMKLHRMAPGALLLAPLPATAQDVPPDMGEMAPEEIVVTGQAQRGAVIGDIQPELQLGPADIRSYGVNSVAELLTELAPQTGSVRGRGGERPVVLLNGRRISGFAEIRDLPTEAIARVDILPEEVALKYGFAANQRVVNFVLRERFRAVTAEVEGGLATEGGGARAEADLDFLRIDGDGRFELAFEYERIEPLLESERAIDRSDLGGPVDQGDLRTLVPTGDTAQLNVVASRSIAEGVAATLNGRVERRDTQALIGLGVTGLAPRGQERDTLDTHLGATLNGAVAGWQWTFTGNYDRVETQVLTDRDAVPAGQERALGVSNVLTGDFTATGTPLRLPAGDVSTTVTLAATHLDFESESRRETGVVIGGARRDIGSGQLSIDLPIASRRRAILAGIGDLSVNGNLQVRRLSDFGALRTWGAGVTWSPWPIVDIVASLTDEEDAPRPQQLADPLVATPLVRVFDFVTGVPVLVTQLTGGNPGLDGDSRRVLKLGLTVRPSIGEADVSLTANLVDSRIDNPIAALPNPTAAIEAAFPGRFVRDANGVLVQVDARPVNFAREDSRRLRWGINLSVPLKTDPERIARLREAGAFGNRPAGAGGPGAGAPPGRGRGGSGGGRNGFGGRAQFALFHSWTFRNDILIAPGGPRLDLLAGDAIGARGGVPRHQLEAQAGFVKDGLGARLSADWQSATRVTDGAGDSLRFGALATVNLRLFANLGVQPGLVRNRPWLRGTRVTLVVDNLFNARQRVTDAAGAVPLSFQPALLDPLGRTARLQFRKLFF